MTAILLYFIYRNDEIFLCRRSLPYYSFKVELNNFTSFSISFVHINFIKQILRSAPLQNATCTTVKIIQRDSFSQSRTYAPAPKQFTINGTFFEYPKSTFA